MSVSEMDKSAVARPAALIVDSDAALREALRQVSGGLDPVEGLTQVLAARGYDVVVTSCPDEARRLMSQRFFERIYSDGTPLRDQALSRPAGPRIEDLGDGTARVQIDQVLPWSAAVELIDALAALTQDKPQRLS
jgi:hypothetical protein